MRPRVIQVDRSNRGFGLSLIYRGLDKYEEKDTGIFVARVVPGGQAARFGVKENDKIISINNRNPRNVDDAVGIIKVGILFYGFETDYLPVDKNRFSATLKNHVSYHIISCFLRI